MDLRTKREERLRDAAPELLARLKQALAYLEHPDVKSIEFAMNSWVCANQCREAIFKAEGMTMGKSRISR